MRIQLDRLVEVAVLPTVTIQIIPYEAGAHPAIDSMFTILEFAVPVDSVVYVEGLLGFIYLDNQKEINRYNQVFEQLRALAWNSGKSIDRVMQVREGIEDRY